MVDLSCERIDENMAHCVSKTSIAMRFCRFYMKWLHFPMFDHHLAVSPHAAGELRDASRGHNVRRGVWLRPMGVDSRLFRPERQHPDIRQWLRLLAGAAESGTLFLYVGRLAPEKNLHLLVQTMELLERESPGVFHMVVAGNGPLRTEFERECEQRVPGAVRFLGHIGERDLLADILANSGIFVHPNPREPFGIAPLEAMSAGLALVAPDSGGVSCYANHSNAWLAPPEAGPFARAVRAIRDDPATAAAAPPGRARYRRGLRLGSGDHGLLRNLRRATRLGARAATRAGDRASLLLHARQPLGEGKSMTRRTVAKLLAGALLPPGLRRGVAGDLAGTLRRRYRADAQVLFLSVPILRRSGVGCGNVLWREWRETAGMLRLLEFAGYSNPDRAAGLNRLGFIRETSCRDENAYREASYFGVMTASPEESADEARKSLHSTAAEATYSAIRGRITGTEIETTSVHFTGPARLSPERHSELYARAEQALAAAPKKPPEFQPTGPAPPPFLHALAEALRFPNNSRGYSESRISTAAASTGCG